jgi:ppGpp synthetase/RelA/SpoT-type nucleotidyltranferase
MPALSSPALRFYREYQQSLDETRARAAAAEGFVRDILARGGLRPYAITSRPKDPVALLAKLRRKQYKSPHRMTDLIGIRVITHYADEVDPIVTALQAAPELIVSRRRSVDKRSDLGLQEFGYRSVHLIVRTRKAGGNLTWYQTLQDQWFEVQTRSVLEHAWAEIEHLIAYKSGVVYPKEFKRTFAALAGTLELLDQQFMDLRRRQTDLIATYRARYAAGQDGDEPWDTARLAGYLSSVRPSGRRESSIGNLDMTRVQALELGGLNTANKLEKAMAQAIFRRRLGAFASLTSQAPDSVSDFVVVAIAASSHNPARLKRQFPELFTDPQLEAAVG